MLVKFSATALSIRVMCTKPSTTVQFSSLLKFSTLFRMSTLWQTTSSPWTEGPSVCGLTTLPARPPPTRSSSSRTIQNEEGGPVRPGRAGQGAGRGARRDTAPSTLWLHSTSTHHRDHRDQAPAPRSPLTLALHGRASGPEPSGGRRQRLLRRLQRHLHSCLQPACASHALQWQQNVLHRGSSSALAPHSHSASSSSSSSSSPAWVSMGAAST